MEKIYQLNTRKMPKAMYLFVGSLYIVMGGFQIYSNQIQTFSVVIGIMLILGGSGYILLGPMTISSTSNLALRVKIGDISFWAKPGLLENQFNTTGRILRKLNLIHILSDLRSKSQLKLLDITVLQKYLSTSKMPSAR